MFEFLSKRANKMLETTKHSHQERSYIISCFEKHNLPIFEPVILFQEHFGGLEFEVEGGKDICKLGIIDHFGQIEEPEISGDNWLFECGGLSAEIINFYIKQNGIINSGPDIASCGEKFIESYAMFHELIQTQSQWKRVRFYPKNKNYYLPGGVETDYLSFLYQNELLMNSYLITEASDPGYTIWWSSPFIKLREFVFLTGKGPHLLDAYAKTSKELNEFIEMVNPKAYGCDLLFSDWPF